MSERGEELLEMAVQRHSQGDKNERRQGAIPSSTTDCDPVLSRLHFQPWQWIVSPL